MKKLSFVKKIFAIALSAMVLITMPIYVIAAPNHEECEAKLLQAGDFDLPYDYDGVKQVNLLGIATHDENMNDIERKLTERIYEALTNKRTTISFYLSEGLSREWAMTMYSNVINDHPELFYVSHNYGVDYVGSTMTKIYPHYVLSSSEIDNAKKVFDAGVQKALAVVDSSMDDMQKALAIHDYICENATYDETGDMSHSAYAFFNTGHIVCAGYALSFSYLMKQLGIECEMVTSIPGNHGWNTVKINGKWYQVDCTWDDTGSSSNGYKPDACVGHYYFLKSKEFMVNSDQTHKEQDTFDDCDAVDTTYDSTDWWWHDVKSKIIIKNGNYYYLDHNATSQVVYLRRRAKNGGEIKLSSYNFKCGDSNSENYARMTYLEGKLFVVAYQRDFGVGYGVYAVDINNGTTSLVKAIGAKPMGIGVDNNQIYYQLNGAPNNYITVDKWDAYKKSITKEKGVNYNGYADMNNDKVINAKDYVMLIDQLGYK